MSAFQELKCIASIENEFCARMKRLVLSPDHILRYVKEGPVTLVDFLGIFRGQSKTLMIFIDLRFSAIATEYVPVEVPVA